MFFGGMLSRHLATPLFKGERRPAWLDRQAAAAALALTPQVVGTLRQLACDAEAMHRLGMSLLAYSPLAGGMLSGKYAGGARPAGSRFAMFDQLGARYRKPMVLEATDAYLALAAECGLTPAQLALGYVRSRWFTGASIIGATSLAQLRENIAGAQFALAPAVLERITEIQLRYPNPAG